MFQVPLVLWTSNSTVSVPVISVSLPFTWTPLTSMVDFIAIPHGHSYWYYICLSVMFVHVCACVTACVEVRGQPVGVCFLLPPRGSHGSYSPGFAAGALSPEPSHQPLSVLLIMCFTFSFLFFFFSFPITVSHDESLWIVDCFVFCYLLLFF